jgi:hypothetical protein
MTIIQDKLSIQLQNQLRDHLPEKPKTYYDGEVFFQLREQLYLKMYMQLNLKMYMQLNDHLFL